MAHLKKLKIASIPFIKTVVAPAYTVTPPLMNIKFLKLSFVSGNKEQGGSPGLVVMGGDSSSERL